MLLFEFIKMPYVFAVVGFLGLGIARSDLRYILLAAILFFVLALSGAAGGIVYYATGGLRARSRLGYYASAILTAYGYLFSVLFLIVLSFTLVNWRDPDAELWALLSSVGTWVVLVVAGALFGLAFGRVMRTNS